MTRSTACTGSCRGGTTRWSMEICPTTSVRYRMPDGGCREDAPQRLTERNRGRAAARTSHLSNLEALHYGLLPKRFPEDHFCVARLRPGREALPAERKTRRCPEEALEFLGYRIGRNSPEGERGYPGLDPARRAFHLPQDQEWTAPGTGEYCGPDGRRPGSHDRGGRILWPGAGQPGLPSDRPPRGPAALAEAKVRSGGFVCGRTTVSLTRTGIGRRHDPD